MLIAATLPYQIAMVVLPSPTFLNELAAAIGWLSLTIVAFKNAPATRIGTPITISLVAIFFLMIVISVHALSGHVSNWSTALHWLFFLTTAILCLLTGNHLAQGQNATIWVDQLAFALICGAILAFAAEISQYLQLEVNPFFISPLNEAGRIYGNMRQPNHMATFLCMGIVASGWLFYRKKIGLFATLLLLTVIIIGIVLTSSRTGIITLATLIFIGIIINRRQKNNLLWLFCLFALVPLSTWALTIIAQHQIYDYYGASRWIETIKNPIENTGTRIELWKNALEILRKNWMIGTGFGQFQFYYLLSNVPIEFPVAFNNAHLLPLQIAAEFGLPVAVVFFGLLLAATYLSTGAVKNPIGLTASLLAMPIFIHSMFEFPLWYLYFLLPTAFLFGLFLGSASIDAHQPNKNTPKGHVAINRIAPAFGGVLILFTLIACIHYLTLAAIYKPGGAGDSIAERRKTANNAFIFKSWVANSMLTSSLLDAPTDDEARAMLPDFDRAARFNMDQLFLYRYTLILTLSGDIERAKRVAYALGLQHSPFIIKLKKYSENRPEKAFKELSEFISNPTELKISAKDFPK